MTAEYRQLFSIPDDIHYINCAYQGPLLKSSMQAGMSAMHTKEVPYTIRRRDFFEPMERIKRLFGQLINCDNPDRITFIPAASYGLANAAANISVEHGQNIVITGEQFPSNYYIWQRLAREAGCELRVVEAPDSESRAADWNDEIHNRIENDTAIVAMAQVHWTDGTLFDLERIGSRCREAGAKFVIDGTQSLGALGFDIDKIKPDALVCAAYKWLLGMYGSGLAYYGPHFDDGRPIEENWINRLDSDNFEGLVDYQADYRPYAYRYGMGESWNFVSTAVLEDSLHHILQWGVDHIQRHAREIFSGALMEMSRRGCWVEHADWRAHHLFGIRVDESFDITNMVQAFRERKVHVSRRGNAIRVSPHLYNNEEDVQALLDAFLASKT